MIQKLDDKSYTSINKINNNTNLLENNISDLLPNTNKHLYENKYTL